MEGISRKKSFNGKLAVPKSFNLKITIKYSNMVYLLMYVCLMNFGFLPFGVMLWIQIVSLMLIVPYVLLNIRHLSIDYVPVDFLLLIMGVIIILSTYLNVGFTTQTVASLYSCLNMNVLFWLIQITNEKGDLQKFLQVGYRFLTLVLILNDILMLALPSRFSGGDDYIVGNKFFVAYLHLMWSVLYGLLNPDHKKKLIFRFLLTFAVCLLVQCTTLGIGILLMMLIYYAPLPVRKWLSFPAVYLGVGAFCDSILLISAHLVDAKPIKYFILHILHEDLTLTGRLPGYRKLGEIIRHQPFFGYGYGNTVTYIYTKGMANAQNGFLDLVINYGMIYAIFFAVVSVVIIAMWHNHVHPKNERKLSLLLAVVYCYVIISMVEIPFDTNFLFYHALLLVYYRQARKVN